ncbi:hypothetical protein FCN77_14795 [Arthrobacter sp. 24S4-2]|uniref:hypothetical protein n=1 Tax=Arthrobacter sp. 24S4-2 TaxID=2575374 RepID=UPI0010C7E1FB|nr:hypothetical protein [Arthrobacter sp. 24S4-2]QCO98740.1 hypothetical protein FCN77_14795 [Arthrobacter sp. 24S4-2]
MSLEQGTGSAADDSGGGAGLDIRALWSRLEPATRQWLMDHTGTPIVPRTITEALCRAADRPLLQDPHGQVRLTEDDLLFIRNRAHSAFAAHGTERFYETVQPENPRRRRAGPRATPPPRT